MIDMRRSLVEAARFQPAMLISDRPDKRQADRDGQRQTETETDRRAERERGRQI